MTAATQIDRGSGVPLYLQIKRILADEIVAVGADAGAMTEQLLTERFRVSRATVRQALQELVKDGLVYRERSKGTFPVQRMDIDRPATLQVGGLVGYLADLGMNPSSEVRDVHRAVPPREVVDALMLDVGETVLTFHRRVFANGQPLSLALVRLRSPEEFLPTAAELEAAGSAIELLEQAYGVRVARSEHRVWATSASSEEAAALALEAGAPVLVLETVMRTREGRPVVWRRIADHADIIKHTFIADL
ncbi:GntR family transcriptional regulator [Microbacterium allomyrinae]|uniref:GntR family transcriptional regulator n=1 Tax=Microbacterium allomyrinae TaxID=2830666 RepID=A0A9X1S133_9MICO|nr:GntR family transcriptional regulator [Microbacterium allomyrinae]MCC2031241.1 GntR family transcriptional regulator [Microbacterium allomyrinae]